ncbi:hypothetical protein MF672_025230 [Actinomadura sp. ATCC 31491]|uniref:Uncharacterized protein n=1 Tax=Actinomadura luzonensis TaxID=2805427 RepID=A0ABT0FXJ8_9ACTN|nr:hypothetical protein [Actinomadura luzonensis]MCK2217070.1 hypothetical protein [Actinomadura luzonensis]
MWPHVNGLRVLDLGAPGELRQRPTGRVPAGHEAAAAGLLPPGHEAEGESFRVVAQEGP